MKYWNKRLKNMSEYIPGEQPENLETYIKLNTNENPFPPSKVVLEAIREACNESLRRYPNPTNIAVRELFARENGFGAENVFLGNGSDEIFNLIFRGFADPGSTAVFPYPSYSLYYTFSEANGIKYDKVDLDDNLDLRLDEFLKKDYSLAIISNPNNPTGKGCDRRQVVEFLKKFKGLLVIDEAYVDFYGETLIDLVKEYDNVIITRSFSKSYSLAGLRVGLAVAHEDIIKGFLKLKDSYNVDRLAEAGALAALRDKKGFTYNIGMLRSNKEYLEERLEDLGFTIVPSKANFLLVRHGTVSPKTIYEELKERKILVRYFSGPVQSEYIRITVGTMMEIKTLMKELTPIVSA
ncbi:MAG TPA: histidinol-phosphate transaminase [Spirochaetota bacterium]|nr:histidinol-phosphate transaminase [Spirochaetota bacterium]HQP47866.1 histidinol-phosphate transaminase [Spirochaetota bacterium]